MKTQAQATSDPITAATSSTLEALKSPEEWTRPEMFNSVVLEILAISVLVWLGMWWLVRVNRDK